MADPLRPWLEKLLKDIEREAHRCEAKSKEALGIHKPFREMSEAEQERYFRKSSDQLIAESDRWMNKQIEAEAAARELKDELFLRGLRYGKSNG